MAYVDTRAVARRERLICAHIERTLSHKHIQFALEHQNDTLEQLTNYLRDCMVDIGHLPRKCEVVGSEYIAMRFDGWENALNTIYSGNKNDAFTRPTPFRMESQFRSSRKTWKLVTRNTPAPSPSPARQSLTIWTFVIRKSVSWCRRTAGF